MSSKPTPADLHEQTTQVQTDFLNADLDIAFTFVDLARLEVGEREIERANSLLSKARQAAALVADRYRDAVPSEQPNLIARREKLVEAIRQVQATLPSR